MLNSMQKERFYRDSRGTIEIDEVLFTHRASPGRRGTRQIWAIGLVEIRPGMAFCFCGP